MSLTVDTDTARSRVHLLEESAQDDSSAVATSTLAESGAGAGEARPLARENSVVGPDLLQLELALANLEKRDAELRTELLAVRANGALSNAEKKAQISALIHELEKNENVLLRTRKAEARSFREEMVKLRSTMPQKTEAKRRWGKISIAIRAASMWKSSGADAKVRRLTPEARKVHERMAQIRSDLYALRQLKKLSVVQEADKKALEYELHDLDTKFKLLLKGDHHQ
eukprot:ANDGO_00330.mRNA.1 hypothetical protein